LRLFLTRIIMPEGPEIKRAADRLDAVLRGRRLIRAHGGLELLKTLATALTGVRVRSVSARGKAMLTRLDNGRVLYTHNQLYGRWEILPDGEYPASSRSLRLALHTGEWMALLYSASEIELLEESALAGHRYLSRLGPELLAPETAEADIVRRFEETRYRRRALFGLLQDQSFISGMGNYLACESLFACGIDPSSRLEDLDAGKRRELAQTCLRLTRQSRETGGITNDLERAAALERQGVDFEGRRFLVYRRAGQPCYRCGQAIAKGRFGGRMGYACPGCQRIR
jgi:endonuclease-8